MPPVVGYVGYFGPLPLTYAARCQRRPLCFLPTARLSDPKESPLGSAVDRSIAASDAAGIVLWAELPTLGRGNSTHRGNSTACPPLRNSTRTITESIRAKVNGDGQP